MGLAINRITRWSWRWGAAVATGTADLVKGWAAILGERGLAMGRSSGGTFFMPQPGDWWDMRTMSNFWHTDFPRVPSRVNQNTNAPSCAQACCLEVILHRHIDFKTWGKLFNSPGVLQLTSLRPPQCGAYIYVWKQCYEDGKQRCISTGGAFCREAVSSSAFKFSLY